MEKKGDEEGWKGQKNGAGENEKREINLLVDLSMSTDVPFPANIHRIAGVGFSKSKSNHISVLLIQALQCDPNDPKLLSSVNSSIAICSTLPLINCNSALPKSL